MITIIRIILFFHEYLNEFPADPSWLHHLPGCKNKSRGSPALNAHILKNRVYQDLPFSCHGTCSPYGTWVCLSKCHEVSVNHKKYSDSQEKKQNRPGCFVIKRCSLFLLTCLLFLPPRLTWSCDKRHTNTFLLPQFHYLTGPVGTFLLAQ